ncbi:MAG: type I restriction endonuclease, partial [Acidithiobacillus ferrivorans]
MSATFTESEVEAAALEWLGSLGYSILHGPDIAPDMPDAERGDFGQVILEGRLREMLARLNPALPAAALDDAFRKLIHIDGASLEARNCAVHRLL